MVLESLAGSLVSESYYTYCISMNINFGLKLIFFVHKYLKILLVQFTSLLCVMSVIATSVFESRSVFAIAEVPNSPHHILR